MKSLVLAFALVVLFHPALFHAQSATQSKTLLGKIDAKDGASITAISTAVVDETPKQWTQAQVEAAQARFYKAQALILQTDKVLDACNPSFVSSLKQAQSEWQTWAKANVPDGYDVKPDLSGIVKRELAATK